MALRPAALFEGLPFLKPLKEEGFSGDGMLGVSFICFLCEPRFGGIKGLED